MVKDDYITPDWPAIVKDKEIRKTFHNDEWWVVVEDVVRALTGSKEPRRYIGRMKRRDLELEKGWEQIVTPLPFETSDGIKTLECANTEGIFWIIQSIPAPNPEPCKQWLSKVGYGWIQEFLDQEPVSRHGHATAISRKNRSPESKSASGTMTHLDNNFYILSEAAATKTTVKQNTEGFLENEKAAMKRNQVVDTARKQLEADISDKVSKHLIPLNHSKWIAK